MKQKKILNKFVSTMAMTTMLATAMVAPTAITPVVAAETGITVKNLTFTDVNSRIQEAVEFVVSKGVQGYSSTKFGSYDQIKRVDAAIILAKVLELDVDNAPETSFKDVPARGKKYVNALYEAGITSGKSSTQFGSNDFITRGEMAIWITRAFELQGSGKVAFTDVSKNYASAVSALIENKIANGFSSTTFGTTTALIRGDFAVLMHRAATLDENGSNNENNGNDSNNDKFSIDYEFGNDWDEDFTNSVTNNGICSHFYDNGVLLIGFNQPLNMEESLKPENFIINGKNPVEVSSDSGDESIIWVYLEDNSLEASKQYDITIKNIVSAKGEKLDTYTAKEFLNENVRPTMTEATMVNDETIRVTFSEPVTYQRDGYIVFGYYVVNGGDYSVIGMDTTNGLETDTQYDIYLNKPVNAGETVVVEYSGYNGNLTDVLGNSVGASKVTTR